MSVSVRDIETMREFRQFIEDESAKKRFAEDQEQYRLYRNQFDADQRRLPPAYQSDPLTFEAFRGLMGDEPDPAFRAAQAVARSLWTEAATIEREHVLNGRDPQLFIALELNGVRMNRDKAQAFNKEQARRFRENTPDYFPNDANLEALVDYFERNEVQIINESMFRAAWERLRSFGAMKERPPAQPQSQSEIQPEEEPVDDGSMVGIDPETGEPKRYSRLQIDRMDSEKFKRCFNLNRERRISAWEEFIVKPARY